jgi:alkanesulfonate monooxygenase SsuD/methylene tetrahydromethanopterin reductase-like flavin-dependent oxidoreductase (luciferase family)
MERPPTPPGPIGLILPTFVQNTVPPWASVSGEDVGDPIAHLAGICSQAEQLGADVLWACDHLFWHGPSLEPLLALTIAATSTRTAALGTCVVQLPLRRPSAVAKQSTTLQALSQGRFILGVGVGSHRGEYEQADIDYHTRGRQLDAGIAELRRSWQTGTGVTAGDISAKGPDRYRQLPGPSPIPVWVGGSSEAALRRAASLADGWMPLFLTADQYADALERLTKELDRANRPVDAVTRSMVLFVSIDDDREKARRRGTEWMSSLYGLPAHAFERHLVGGTTEEVAETVGTYRRAGAEHVAIYITADEPLEQFGQLTAALATPDARARG